MLKWNSVFAAGMLCGCFGLCCLTACSAPAAEPAPATQQAVDPTPVNKMCAVDTDQPIDPKVTLIYDGKTYGFCCKDCVAKFNADPEKYAANAK
jgi:YHS domain-containing protein